MDAEGSDRLVFQSIEIDGAPGLGGRVRVELGDGKTVLVGRNGAGKSVLIGSISGLMRAAARSPFSTTRPWGGTRGMRCDCRSNNNHFSYEFVETATLVRDESDDSPPRVDIDWKERCWRPGTQEYIWKVEDEKLTVGASEPESIARGRGLLSEPSQSIGECNQLRSAFRRVGCIPAGIPRATDRQEEILFLGDPRRAIPRWKSMSHGSVPFRIEGIAAQLIAWFGQQQAEFREFKELARKLGVAEDVSINVVRDPRMTIADEDRQDIVLIDFDQTNIGLLSDGTLRVAEILVQLLRPNWSMLLIEEPETAVHPGLLRRLLAIIDSYTVGRQTVVSTHSPLVVDWCNHAHVRMVWRNEGVTRVAPVESDVDRLEAYLNDEGTLADWVFSRCPGD